MHQTTWSQREVVFAKETCEHVHIFQGVHIGKVRERVPSPIDHSGRSQELKPLQRSNRPTVRSELSLFDLQSKLDTAMSRESEDRV